MEDLPDFAGKTDLQILREIASVYDINYDIILSDIDSIWERMLFQFKDYCNTDYLYTCPGAVELVKELNLNDSLTLGLLTGNFKENAYLKLSAHSLDEFFMFGAFGSDHEDRNQLPPIAINRANEFFGRELFNRGNTIIIGDSPRDIECAKTNGLKVVAVATGQSSYEELNDLIPDLLFEDFSDYQSVIIDINQLVNSGI